MSSEAPPSGRAGRGLAAFPTTLLCFQTLKIALALASRLGDPVYDSTITESMEDMLRFVLLYVGTAETGVDVGEGIG